MTRAGILLGLLLAVALALPAAAGVLEKLRGASVPVETASLYAETDRFIENYYLYGEPAAVAPFLVKLNQTRMLEEFAEMRLPVAVFMGELLRKYPEKAAVWLQPPVRAPKWSKGLQQSSGSYGPALKETLNYAAWRAGLLETETVKKIFPDQQEYTGKTPPVPMESPVLTQEDYDALWATFFATGDKAVADRLVDVACGYQDSSGLPLPDMRLIVSARLRLSDMAAAHELVDRAIRRRVGLKTPCLAEIEKVLARPIGSSVPGTQDGEFTTFLRLADYTEATQRMALPASEAFAVPEITTVRPGDKVAILLFFSGMQLKDDLTSDVEYDITLISPSGAPLGKGTLTRHLRPAKLPSRYVLHHPDSFPNLFFREAFDAGTYTVKVEARDKFGLKKVSLEKPLLFVKDKKPEDAQKKP